MSLFLGSCSFGSAEEGQVWCFIRTSRQSSSTAETPQLAPALFPHDLHLDLDIDPDLEAATPSSPSPSPMACPAG